MPLVDVSWRLFTRICDGLYNETGIDISLIVAYHHKYHQNKTNNRISSAGMFVFVGINHWRRPNVFFRRQQWFVRCFFLAAAKSALTILIVKYRVLLTFWISGKPYCTAITTDARQLYTFPTTQFMTVTNRCCFLALRFRFVQIVPLS